MADDKEDEWLYGDPSNLLKQDDDKSMDDEEGQLTISEDQEDVEEPNLAVNPSPPPRDNSISSTIEQLTPKNGTEDTADTNEKELVNLKLGENLEEGQLDESQGNAKEEGSNIETDPKTPLDDEVDDDSDDDNINVVIGTIKPSTTITSLASAAMAKRGLIVAEKAKQGKFVPEEFDTIGSINGVPAHEFNLDSLEEKPWRKPGADITDYFNYGFNETTWAAYCDRQKKMRLYESGVGLPSTGGGQGGLGGNLRILSSSTRKPISTIDVIGGVGNTITTRREIRENTNSAVENPIQVMTAERREYSRKTFDVSVPPPGYDHPPPPIPVPTMITYPQFPVQSPASAFYSEPPPYYPASYEPSQESQWRNAAWDGPPEEDTKHHSPDISSHDSEDHSRSHRSGSVLSTVSVLSGMEDRESRRRERDRDREMRSHDRERSTTRHRRSRSRSTESRASTRERKSKRRSRSRSPSHKHKKKKSKSDKKDREGRESSSARSVRSMSVRSEI